mmetsp:Transcript_4651/g.5348  ORF Transcript_4651/g.5348 Transcript_4651/m.5348 type:complete len:153 (+) Transcript_4651:10-468(+)
MSLKPLLFEIMNSIPNDISPILSKPTNRTSSIFNDRDVVINKLLSTSSSSFEYDNRTDPINKMRKYQYEYFENNGFWKVKHTFFNFQANVYVCQDLINKLYRYFILCLNYKLYQNYTNYVYKRYPWIFLIMKEESKTFIFLFLGALVSKDSS